MSGEPQPVYPLFLTHLNRVLVVVVGGGRVATRKVAGLLEADAKRIHIFSPKLTPQLQTWQEEGRIVWTSRTYVEGDLVGAGLAYAATDVRAVNAAVAKEAETRGILCNVVDAPDEGSFHVPAVDRRADIVIAVGSGGLRPARSKQVRTLIAQWLAANNLES